MHELRIHGRGGQGVVTMAELLAKTAVLSEKQAQTLPFFGVERRGAVVKACVRIDQSPIRIRSMSYCPDSIALMHRNLLPFAQSDGFGENTFFIVNAHEPIAVKADQWLVDASDIAIANDLVFGGEPFINVPMVGAIARVIGLSMDSLEQAIRNQWQGNKAVKNLQAALQAYQEVHLIKAGEGHE